MNSNSKIKNKTLGGLTVVIVIVVVVAAVDIVAVVEGVVVTVAEGSDMGLRVTTCDVTLLCDKNDPRPVKNPDPDP